MARLKKNVTLILAGGKSDVSRLVTGNAGPVFAIGFESIESYIDGQRL